MTTEEAREAAIQVMTAKCLTSRKVCEELLDALLAATQDEPCETCGGTGKEPGYVAPLGHPDSARCVKCNGSGRVPGPPLVLLGPEQVGWLGNKRGIVTSKIELYPEERTSAVPLYRSQRETQS